jgi:hypothetical protein
MPVKGGDSSEMNGVADVALPHWRVSNGPYLAISRTISGSPVMTTITESVERHHKPIIISLLSLIVLFLVACAFNDVIPICHYIFGCDHSYHAVT